jgi:hypothetical protein
MSQSDVSTKEAFSLKATLAVVWKNMIEAGKRSVPMALCFTVAIPFSYGAALGMFPDYPWLPLSTQTDPIAVMHQAFTVYSGFWVLSFLFYFVNLMIREMGGLQDKIESDFVGFIKSNPPTDKLRRVIGFVYLIFAIPAVLCLLMLASQGELMMGILFALALVVNGVLYIRFMFRRAKWEMNHGRA